MRSLRWTLAAFLLLGVPGLAHAACSTGQTSCSTDTTTDAQLVAAINDPITEQRVWNLWNAQCGNIFSELASTTGHTFRNNMCLSIAAGKVPLTLLVSSIIDSTTAPEITSCAPTPGPSANPQSGAAAGCLVDADVNTAIGTALTVGFGTASTTATASNGSPTITVASGTGIFYGQNAYCAGCPTGATVVSVSGTTVYLSAAVAAALSSTPIVFSYAAGLPTAPWVP